MADAARGAGTHHRSSRPAHAAVVDIEHDTRSYSIKYRDSTNLNAGDGMIHSNYNGWIQNLEKAIRVQTSF